MGIINFIKGNPLVKSGAKYSLTATAASIVGMIVSLLNMRWIGPSELGIWQSLCVVSAYIPFLQLGIQSGLNLDLPVLLGKKDEVKAQRYIANAFYASIAITALILAAGLVATLFAWLKGMGLKYVFGILALTIVNAGSSICSHYIARYRSSMSFDVLTSIIRIQIVTGVICVPLIYFWGFWGLLLYNAVPGIVYASFMIRRSPFADIKPLIIKKDISYLVKRGAIQMLFVQTSTAIKTFPQIFLLGIGGTIMVGLFSPALAIKGIVNLLPNQVAQFLIPQLGYKYGSSSQAKKIWPYVKKILLYMPLLILPFSLLLFFLLPYLINAFFPKYTESIMAMQIMALGFVFSSSSITTNFLYTIKGYKEASYIIMAEILSYLFFPMFFYKVVGTSVLISTALAVASTYFVVYITTFMVMKVTLFKDKYNNKEMEN